MIDLITNLDYKRSVNEIAEKGLFVELKSFNSHIFAIIGEKVTRKTTELYLIFCGINLYLKILLILTQYFIC